MVKWNHIEGSVSGRMIEIMTCGIGGCSKCSCPIYGAIVLNESSNYKNLENYIEGPVSATITVMMFAVADK